MKVVMGLEARKSTGNALMTKQAWSEPITIWTSRAGHRSQQSTKRTITRMCLRSLVLITLRSSRSRSSSELIALSLCSDYLKRDDQYLAFRLQNEEARTKMTKTAKDRDRALAMAKSNEAADGDAEADGDATMEDAEDTPAETAGSKVIVIHIGSQNLRIGLSSDALPKTVPMVIARKSATNESENLEEPRPKRVKRDESSEEPEPEQLFGTEVRAKKCHMKHHFANANLC